MYLNKMLRCPCGHSPRDHRTFDDLPEGPIGCRAMVGPFGFPKECSCTNSQKRAKEAACLAKGEGRSE